MPDEIAHNRVSDYIARGIPAQEAQLLNHSLCLRKGFPVAKPVHGARVNGFLLHIRGDKYEEAIAKLSRYEEESYKCDEAAKVLIPETDTRQRVTAFVAKEEFVDLEDYVDGRPWCSLRDPLLTQGLKAIRAQLDALPPMDSNEDLYGWTQEYWQRMIPLEGMFMVLCSIVERLASLRNGNMSEIGRAKGFRKMAKYKPFERAMQAARTMQDFSTAALHGEPDTSPTQLDNYNQLDYWYKVRSNLTHQGKSSKRDRKILEPACHDLLRVLEELAKIGQSK